MAVDTLLFRTANRQANGRLTQILLRQRDKGLSFDEIARRLYGEYGIEVTGQTLSNWHSKWTHEPEPAS